MTLTRLIRAELRKLTTTRMPIAFVAVLVAISATTAIAVIFGTDFDGSKGFISTADDQLSLMAFASNAMMIAGLFGAIAVAREYGHGTVVPTYLAAPRRGRAVVAQLAAVLVGGAVLGLIGAGLTVAAVAAAPSRPPSSASSSRQAQSLSSSPPRRSQVRPEPSSAPVSAR